MSTNLHTKIMDAYTAIVVENREVYLSTKLELKNKRTKGDRFRFLYKLLCALGMRRLMASTKESDVAKILQKVASNKKYKSDDEFKTKLAAIIDKLKEKALQNKYQKITHEFNAIKQTISEKGIEGEGGSTPPASSGSIEKEKLEKGTQTDCNSMELKEPSEALKGEAKEEDQKQELNLESGEVSKPEAANAEKKKDEPAADAPLPHQIPPAPPAPTTPPAPPPPPPLTNSVKRTAEPKQKGEKTEGQKRLSLNNGPQVAVSLNDLLEAKKSLTSSGSVKSRRSSIKAKVEIPSTPLQDSTQKHEKPGERLKRELRGALLGLIPLSDLLQKFSLEEIQQELIAKDKEGETALHRAIRVQLKYPILRWIVEHGGDPSIQNNEGMTALELYKREVEEGRDLAILELLIPQLGQSSE